MQPYELRIAFNVVCKLARNQQIERMQRRGDCACRRPRQPTRKSSRQHDNSVGAERISFLSYKIFRPNPTAGRRLNKIIYEY